MRLTLLTPPAVEPIALVDAKLFLKIDIVDDDSIVTSLITAARQYVETRLRQALITQTWRLDLDSIAGAGGYYNPDIRKFWMAQGGTFPGGGGGGVYSGVIPVWAPVIDIPVPPLQSVSSVKYFDFQNVQQTVDPTIYNVSLGKPGRIQPAYSKVWPPMQPRVDAFQVTFVAGYGDTSATVPAAIIAAMKLCLGHWYENRQWVMEGAAAIVPETVDALLSTYDHGSYA